MDSVVVVTGANSGIGYAASEQLARRGATVVMGCRSPQRGEAARASLVEATGSERIHLVQLDTSSLVSVERFAATVAERWPVLHALVQNAGAFDVSQTEPAFTDAGFESIWATNYLGPCRLASLLRPQLEAAGPGRVIDVSSKGLLAYPFLKLDPDGAAAGQAFSPQRAYYHSKLAALTHTLAMAREADPEKLVAHAVWVPAVKVALDRLPPLSPLQRWLYMLKRRFALEPEQMAETYVALCLEPAWAECTGCLVDDQQRTVRPPSRALDPDTAAELAARTREQLARV